LREVQDASYILNLIHNQIMMERGKQTIEIKSI